MSRVGRDLSISSTDRAWSRQVALIWIISGTQGVGKTTVSRRLAETFDRSVHLEGDRLRRMIVRGERGVATANWDVIIRRNHEFDHRQLTIALIASETDDDGRGLSFLHLRLSPFISHVGCRHVAVPKACRR
jgi:adenylate kinase family enzyme